jgi:hypothetical protein
MAMASRVLVAFDADETGDEKASWWTEHLPHAVRLRPTRHDVNEMLTAGDDLTAWIHGEQNDGPTEPEETNEAAKGSLLSSAPEELFNMFDTVDGDEKKAAILEGAMLGTNTEQLGRMIGALYGRTEMTRIFRAALSHLDHWDSQDIASVAGGARDRMAFPDDGQPFE